MKQQRGEHDLSRSQGGPSSSHEGSSHQGGSHAATHRDRDDHGPAAGQPTNPDRSRVSGGGGERDRHHTHDPKQKA